MLFLGSFLRSILLLAEYHLVQTTATFMIPSTVLFPLLNRSQITSIWHGHSSHDLREDHRSACDLPSRVISASNGHSVDMV
jgi:hypothetical protein